MQAISPSLKQSQSDVARCVVSTMRFTVAKLALGRIAYRKALLLSPCSFDRSRTTAHERSCVNDFVFLVSMLLTILQSSMIDPIFKHVVRASNATTWPPLGVNNLAETSPCGASVAFSISLVSIVPSLRSGSHLWVFFR